MWITSENTNRK